ncbi:hypothetical protein NE865_02564 [Phthorimaea operculella]|nr:hypothetical protein NE865_02564 [Phthorimaea operculella]
MNNSSNDQTIGTHKMNLGPLDYRWRYFSKNQHYVTNRKHAVSEKNLEKPTRPFYVPKSEKLLSYVKYNQLQEDIKKKRRLNLPVRFKANARGTDKMTISSRLYIKNPKDNVKTIVDISPDFYNVVQGRPLRKKDDIKVYIESLRNYAMSRQQIGYRYDIIEKLDKDERDELNEFNNIENLLKKHRYNFSEFLKQDHRLAKVILSTTDKHLELINAANQELLAVASVIRRLTSELYKLDFMTNVLKVYRRFLMVAAPLPWRRLHDETIKNRSLSIQYKSDPFLGQVNDLVSATDIDKIVQEAQLEFKRPLPAAMYFNNPVEIMYMFRSMELQSREYLLINSKNRFPYIYLKLAMTQFDSMAKEELDYFKYAIDMNNKKLERECYNEKYLQEKFNRVLSTTFYETVASEEVLKLKNCVEYVYEQVFGACDHRSLREPVRILEVTYEEYNRKLDELNFNIVKDACKMNFKQDLIKTLNSIRAHRELQSFNKLTNAMKNSFTPPAKYRRPVFEKFAEKKIYENKLKIKKQRMKMRRSTISSDERDCLLAFTNWCEGTDPTEYLKDYYKYVHPVFALQSEQSSTVTILQ